MLEAADGGFFWAEVLEVMRRVLLCMLDAVEGEVCLLEVLELLKVVEVLMVFRCVLLCASRNLNSLVAPYPNLT